MSIMDFLANHSHYWGMIHRSPTDSRLIQICYECGKEREVKVDLIQAHQTSEVLNDDCVTVRPNEIHSSQVGFRPDQIMLTLLKVFLAEISLVLRKP